MGRRATSGPAPVERLADRSTCNGANAASSSRIGSSGRPLAAARRRRAPAFDQLTKAVEAPYPSVRAYSAAFPCKCWSQRGFALVVPKPLCEQLAREPMDLAGFGAARTAWSDQVRVVGGDVGGHDDQSGPVRAESGSRSSVAASPVGSYAPVESMALCRTLLELVRRSSLQDEGELPMQCDEEEDLPIGPDDLVDLYRGHSPVFTLESSVLGLRLTAALPNVQSCEPGLLALKSHSDACAQMDTFRTALVSAACVHDRCTLELSC